MEDVALFDQNTYVVNQILKINEESKSQQPQPNPATSVDHVSTELSDQIMSEAELMGYFNRSENSDPEILPLSTDSDYDLPEWALPVPSPSNVSTATASLPALSSTNVEFRLLPVDDPLQASVSAPAQAPISASNLASTSDVVTDEAAPTFSECTLEEEVVDDEDDEDASVAAKRKKSIEQARNNRAKKKRMIEELTRENTALGIENEEIKRGNQIMKDEIEQLKKKKMPWGLYSVKEMLERLGK